MTEIKQPNDEITLAIKALADSLESEKGKTPNEQPSDIDALELLLESGDSG